MKQPKPFDYKGMEWLHRWDDYKPPKPQHRSFDCPISYGNWLLILAAFLVLLYWVLDNWLKVIP